MVSTSKTSPVCLVHLVDLVYFVYLVHLVSFVQPNKRDKPNKLFNSLLPWRTFQYPPMPPMNLSLLSKVFPAISI